MQFLAVQRPLLVMSSWKEKVPTGKSKKHREDSICLVWPIYGQLRKRSAVEWQVVEDTHSHLPIKYLQI